MKIRTDFVTNSSSSSYVYTIGFITKTGEEFSDSIYMMDDDEPDTSNYGKPVKVNTNDLLDAATMDTIDEMIKKICDSMYFEDTYEGNESVFYDIDNLDRDDVSIDNIDEIFVGMSVESFGESEFPLEDFPDDKIQSMFSKVKSNESGIEQMADTLLETLPYRDMPKEKVIEKINQALQENDVFSLTPLVQAEQETVKIKLNDKKISLLKKYTWDFYNDEIVQGKEFLLKNIKDVALLKFENDEHANKHFSGQAIDLVSGEEKLSVINEKED